MVNIGVVLILWFGGYSVNNGNMEAGKIIGIKLYDPIVISLLMTTRVLNMFIWLELLQK